MHGMADDEKLKSALRKLDRRRGRPHAIFKALKRKSEGLRTICRGPDVRSHNLLQKGGGKHAYIQSQSWRHLRT